MGDGAAIVIVEDEYIVALDIQRHLERYGYTVKGVFPSGEELLERFEELCPDLVLMDIKLQGKLDGVETSAQLNDRWAVPVILLTAYADETTLARAKITQPFGYLLKPFEERELRTSIEIALYRAKMEKKIRERDRLLSQAQKMEAVGRLAGGIAHDFNNILTAILGYANLLTEEVGSSPSIRDDVEGVRKAANRAKALTRQLLAFSRRQPLEPRVLNSVEVLKDMERMLMRLLPAGISLHLRLGEPTLFLKIDETQFEQIVLNLVVNAKDAILSGGNIEIRLVSRCLESSAAGRVEQIPEGSYVVLIVRDSGMGISAENLEYIFEPFFTTKGKDGGTGLGLATVYGIVKQSGGYLDLESSEGRGTTFSLYFPAVQEGADESGARQPEKDLSQGTETILVVEDDEEIKTLMERSLSRRGYTVYIASNPGEALLITERYADDLDLLVSDIGLPFMSGIDLVDRLRKILPELRVLFVSGYADQAPSGDNTMFLQKPFTDDELASAVRKLLDEKTV